MFKKSFIIASALLAAIFVFQPVEQADARVNVHIGVGAPFFYGGPYYGGPYYYGPYYGRRHYVRPRRSYRRISCARGRRIVRARGYYRVRARDCTGKSYSFTAKKHGRWYRIHMRSRNGRIYRIRRL